MIRVAEGAGGSIGLIAQAHDWMFVQIVTDFFPNYFVILICFFPGHGDR